MQEDVAARKFAMKIGAAPNIDGPPKVRRFEELLPDDQLFLDELAAAGRAPYDDYPREYREAAARRVHEHHRRSGAAAPRVGRTRGAARRRGAGRPRGAVRRSSAASGDSGDEGPGEPPPPRLRLVKPRATYSFGVLTAEQRGEVVA